MFEKLDRTVALVIGASSGIGRASALRLAKAGASVGLVAVLVRNPGAVAGIGEDQAVALDRRVEDFRVGICGELDADEALTEAFLRLGVDELSVAPSRILPLREKIRSLTLG